MLAHSYIDLRNTILVLISQTIRNWCPCICDRDQWHANTILTFTENEKEYKHKTTENKCWIESRKYRWTIVSSHSVQQTKKQTIFLYRHESATIYILTITFWYHINGIWMLNTYLSYSTFDWYYYKLHNQYSRTNTHVPFSIRWTSDATISFVWINSISMYTKNKR